MSSAKTYICLDIGGTYIKHGLLTETGEILISGKIPPGKRRRAGGFEQAVELVEAIWKKDYLEKKTFFESRQKAFGIAISGRWWIGDRDHSSCFRCHSGYAGINYKAYMEGTVSSACAVENDVNCAGLAEVFPVPEGSRINLCLTVGDWDRRLPRGGWKGLPRGVKQRLRGGLYASGPRRFPG